MAEDQAFVRTSPNVRKTVGVAIAVHLLCGRNDRRIFDLTVVITPILM